MSNEDNEPKSKLSVTGQLIGAVLVEIKKLELPEQTWGFVVGIAVHFELKPLSECTFFGSSLESSLVTRVTPSIQQAHRAGHDVVGEDYLPADKRSFSDSGVFLDSGFETGLYRVSAISGFDPEVCELLMDQLGPKIRSIYDD